MITTARRTVHYVVGGIGLPRPSAWRICLVPWFWTHACAVAEETAQFSPIDTRQFCSIAHIHDVTIASARKSAQGHIFHLLDIHHIEWSAFAAIARTFDPDALAYQRDALREEYKREMNEVKTIQEEHKSVLRDVVRRFNIRSVYVEGLAADNPAVREFLASVRLGEHHLQRAAKANVRLRNYLDNAFRKSVGPFGKNRSPNYIPLFKEKYGAAAELFLSGDLPGIEPVEDSVALGNGTRATADGRVRNSHLGWEPREDAMVGNMLRGRMPALIVLGAAHDLEDNIKRASGDSCDYIRIQSNRCWARRNEWGLESLAWRRLIDDAGAARRDRGR